MAGAYTLIPNVSQEILGFEYFFFQLSPAPTEAGRAGTHTLERIVGGLQVYFGELLTQETDDDAGPLRACIFVGAYANGTDQFDPTASECVVPFCSQREQDRSEIIWQRDYHPINLDVTDLPFRSAVHSMHNPYIDSRVRRRIDFSQHCLAMGFGMGAELVGSFLTTSVIVTPNIRLLFRQSGGLGD